jgi:outer membrane protein assembly factor BamB
VVQRPQGGSGLAQTQDLLYVGSREGRVFALNPESRSRGLSFPTEGEWIFPADKEKLGAIYGTPVLSGDTLYLGTSDGKLYALDAKTGRSKWQNPFPDKGAIIGGLAVAGDTIFVASADKLHAIDAESGRPRWQPFAADERIWSSPVVQEDTVYFGSLDHRFYALDAKTGKERWSFSTEGAIVGTALVRDRAVYFGAFDGKLYALDSKTGSPLWEEPFSGDSWFWGKAVYGGGRVFASTVKGSLYAIDARTGKQAWGQPFKKVQGPVSSSPVLVGDTLVMASADGTVYGLNQRSGVPEWQASVAEKPISADLAASEETVYVHAEDGTVYALDVERGRIQWSFSLKR